MATTIQGACHCGNISFEMTTAIALPDIVARACDCSFCRIHGALNWSDPKGHARLTILDVKRLQRYLFALKTAQFYICRTCGAYVGAVLSDQEGTWSTLNLRLAELPGMGRRSASDGGESTADRVLRRKQKWTPTVIDGL